jgi:UDP-N-acetylglucosamine 2-epimerase
VRVLSVVGNRPQFIKSAPLSVALREARIDEVVVHTGQHYDRQLSQVFFEELDLPPPDYALDLHTSDVEAMRPGVLEAIREARPDWVLVYGDTNSTLAGAQAGSQADVPVAHVEAGLRSGDLSMPEERNRIEVDRTAALLLAPDGRSCEMLAAEGVRGRREVVGDVMYDACVTLAPIARQRSRALDRFGVEPDRFLLTTVHRESNVRPERLARIVEGLNRLDEPIVFPAHPRTRSVISGLGAHVALTEPLGYLDLAALAAQARVILTDSGGLQKEAYWYGVPCVTLRPSTEWVDTVELGANVLVDDDPDRIAEAVTGAALPPDLPPLYGDGRASARIATALGGSSGECRRATH